MENELLIKIWKEVKEKFEVLRKLEDKLDVLDKEKVIYLKLCEEVYNVCDNVRVSLLRCVVGLLGLVFLIRVLIKR